MPSLLDTGKVVGSPASVRQLAMTCGLPFPLSLKAFMAAPGCPFALCNLVHIKILTDPTIPIATMLRRMREVYSTAGIRVVVMSRENLTAAGLGATTFNDLNDLDTGTCTSGSTSTEQDTLFQNENGVAAGQRNNEIVAYFVRSVAKSNGESLNGCASFPAGHPVVAIAQYASRWTMAHEIGHNLGLSHIPGEDTACPGSNPHCCSTPDFTRLMTGCGTSNITGTPTVSAAEIATMTSNHLSRAC